MRQTITYILGALWMALLFPPFALAMLPWPTQRWRLKVSGAYSRVWSRTCLWIAGIRLEISGREHLRTIPAVLTFNHSNLLDFFVNACFCPLGTLVFGKRELARVPFLGWIWFLGGHPMIVRHDREHWQGVLDSVEARLASGHYRTIVAPEGTRSRDGTLLPFKKGPFHLAAKSGAAIVPVVLDGAIACLDRQGLHPGTIRVRVLPPVPTADWDPEQLDEPIARVRGLYVEALGERAAPEPAGDAAPA